MIFGGFGRTLHLTSIKGITGLLMQDRLDRRRGVVCRGDRTIRSSKGKGRVEAVRVEGMDYSGN